MYIEWRGSRHYTRHTLLTAILGASIELWKMGEGERFDRRQIEDAAEEISVYLSTWWFHNGTVYYKERGVIYGVQEFVKKPDLWGVRLIMILMALARRLHRVTEAGNLSERHNKHAQDFLLCIHNRLCARLMAEHRDAARRHHPLRRQVA